MRQITEKAIEAFLEGADFHLDNTKVVSDDDYTYLELHGSIIARRSTVSPFKIDITTAGWDTVTTRSRLNGLPGVRVNKHQHRLYLNEVEWDGQWKTL